MAAISTGRPFFLPHIPAAHAPVPAINHYSRHTPNVGFHGYTTPNKSTAAIAGSLPYTLAGAQPATLQPKQQ